MFRNSLRSAVCVVCAALFACPAAGASDFQWHSLAIRSQAEFELGLPGGEAEQHPHGIARSLSNPDVLYLSHDVGQIWRSNDNGLTWQHTGGSGMYVHAGQSVQVDPVDPNLVFAIADNSWNWLAANYTGLYRSADGGANWQLVLPTATIHQRTQQQNIAFDLGSTTASGAQRWYAGFADNGLYRSEDAGNSWQKQHDLTGHDRVYGVQVHPTDGNRVFVNSSQGLYLSTGAGTALQPLGNLPAGHVPSLDINAANPNDIYATVTGQGLYRSLDGGQSFSQVYAFNVMYASVHPEDRDRIYLIGQSGASSRVTTNGGQSWYIPQTQPAPGLGREGSWKGQLSGPFSALLPDPRNPDSAVGYSRATIWRTEDGGRTFLDSSTGFTGFAWGWFTASATFDRFDLNRFAFLNADVGMTVTRTGGDYFEHAPIPFEWRRDGLVPFSGTYAGDIQPIPGSDVIVATAGLTWNTKLIRSENGGQTWSIVHDDLNNHLYVRFHTGDPNVVYAGNKRSDDAGRTFQHLPALVSQGAEIMGMAETRPDTVYALNSTRRTILRSDDRGNTWYEYAQTDWAMRRMDSKPTFLVDPGNENRVYSIDRHGDLAVFDGEVWRSLGVLDLAQGRPQGNFVRNVAVDPNYPDIIYAGTNAPGLPFLFRSLDAGLTWEDITGDLPQLGIMGLAVHPITGDVFIGSHTGTRLLAPPYESPDSLYHRLVPEPGSMAAIGVAAVLLLRRNRARR